MSFFGIKRQLHGISYNTGKSALPDIPYRQKLWQIACNLPKVIFTILCIIMLVKLANTLCTQDDDIEHYLPNLVWTV